MLTCKKFLYAELEQTSLLQLDKIFAALFRRLVQSDIEARPFIICSHSEDIYEENDKTIDVKLSA